VHIFDPCATEQALTAINRHTGKRRTLVREPISLSGAMFHRRAQARKAAIGPLHEHDPLLWPSDRTGWNHWYVLDPRDPDDVVMLTHGEFDVEEIVHVNAEGMVYFLAHTDPARPFDTHLCRVSPDGARQVVLAAEPGDPVIRRTRGDCTVAGAGTRRPGDRSPDRPFRIDDLAGTTTQCGHPWRPAGLSSLGRAVACRSAGPPPESGQAGGE
jgi:hypothetical protein